MFYTENNYRKDDLEKNNYINDKTIFKKFLHSQNKLELFFFLFLSLFPFSWLLVGSIISLSIRGIIFSSLIMSIIGLPTIIRYLNKKRYIVLEDFVIEKVKVENKKFSLLRRTIRVKFSNKSKYQNMSSYEDWRINSYVYYVKLYKTDYYITGEMLESIN